MHQSTSTLKSVRRRELGKIHPYAFKKWTESKYIANMQLNHGETMEHAAIHRGVSVNCLDIECIEQRYLLSGSLRGTIAIHDLHNMEGKPLCTYKLINQKTSAQQHSVDTVQWYPIDTGMFTTSGADEKLKVWDTNTFQQIDAYALNGIVYSHAMSSIALSSALVAVGSNNKNKLQLIDLRTGSATHVLKGHKDSVLDIKWSTVHPHYLASAGLDRQAKVWDVRSTKSSLFTLDRRKEQSSREEPGAHASGITSLLFSHDGHHLMTSGNDRKLHLWDMSTGRMTRSTRLAHAPKSSKSSYFFKKRLGAASTGASCRQELAFLPFERTVLVIDVMNGKRQKILTGHYNQVNSCVYNHSTMTLYSAGCDGNVLVWTVNSDSVTEYKQHRMDSHIQKPNLQQDEWSSDDD